jgi:methionyl-tRNA formyltransferase
MTEPAAIHDHALPRRIVFMGTPEFAAASLGALIAAGSPPEAVFTQPDKPAGRGKHLVEPPVKRAALEAGLRVLQPGTLKEPGIREAIAGLRPDVIAVAAYGKLLPKAVLEIPPLGCVNVHASLLPRHRGASPIAHCILAGDAVTGVSIMRMEEGLDTGPVYLTGEIGVPPDATTGSLTPVLAELGARLLVKALRRIAAGDLPPLPQEEARATLAPRIRAGEGLLDFRCPSRELERRVRAFFPWPCAHLFVRGERVKVLSAAVGPPSPEKAFPGEVLDGPGLRVACGDGGSLLVGQMQREGKRPLPSAEVLRGFKIPKGTDLSPKAG